MTSVSDEKIEDFLALFDGEIDSAHQALDRYLAARSQKPQSMQASDDGILEPIITIENVSKSYKVNKQTVTALRDVSLSIGKSEFVAITGASGSGKSTLLQLIGCLDKPSSGQIIIESRDTTMLSDNGLSQLRQEAIGFTFQSFYLQPFLRLEDNLAVPAMFAGLKKTEIRSRVDELLLRVGLSERAKHFPKELSGGQIQRAAIARSLINNPRIILADEPTGNLDSRSGQAVIELFREIRDQLGTTVVVVTHDATIARQADRVITLRDGVIV